MTEDEKSLVDYILEQYEVVDDDSVLYRLKNTEQLSDYELSPSKAIGELKRLFDMPRILNESVLITLLIKYEECISGIFRFLLENYSEAYLSDKNITYAELMNLPSDIQEIKRCFVDKEVEVLMRKPISDWYKMIKDKHKIQFLFEDEVFDEFIEVYYSRNIIVHNQGIVNETYNGFVKASKYEIGQRLHVNHNYIERAIDNTMIILIGTLCGLKKLADDGDKLNDYLFNYGYECLVQNNWRLARFINWVLLNDKTQEEAQLQCERVNYWIAAKKEDGIDSIREKLEELDVSLMSKRFALAKYALLEENEKVASELDNIINIEITAEEIAEWPLFDEFRNSNSYKEFLEHHKEDFALLGYDPKEGNGEIAETSIEIEREKEDLIKQLEESYSFSQTHSLINSLSEYSDWAAEEIERLCRIAIQNTQVQWILDDDDVRVFYEKILNFIDGEKLGNMAKELKNILDSKPSI